MGVLSGYMVVSFDLSFKGGIATFSCTPYLLPFLNLNERTLFINMLQGRGSDQSLCCIKCHSRSHVLLGQKEQGTKDFPHPHCFKTTLAPDHLLFLPARLVCAYTVLRGHILCMLSGTLAVCSGDYAF